MPDGYPICLKKGDSLLVNGISLDANIDLYIEAEDEIQLAVDLWLLSPTPNSILKWRERKRKNREKDNASQREV